jgi:DNA-binding transcriptional regulator/RsmH inhibitor MraZ
VEVWDKDKWENNIDLDDDDMDEIAEHMAELGVGI